MVDNNELYFYEPIKFFDGKVLKCAGICLIEDRGGCKANKEALIAKCELPGYVILEGYRGDRIRAEDFAEYKN